MTVNSKTTKPIEFFSGSRYHKHFAVMLSALQWVSHVSRFLSQIGDDTLKLYHFNAGLWHDCEEEELELQILLLLLFCYHCLLTNICVVINCEVATVQLKRNMKISDTWYKIKKAAAADPIPCFIFAAVLVGIILGFVVRLDTRLLSSHLVIFSHPLRGLEGEPK